jgi:arylsulfatase A-like enzyme
MLVVWGEALFSAWTRPEDGLPAGRLLAGAFLDYTAIGLVLAALMAVIEKIAGRLHRDRQLGSVALASALAATFALSLGARAALREPPFNEALIPDFLPPSLWGTLAASLAFFLPLRFALGGLMGRRPLRIFANGPIVPRLTGIMAIIGLLGLLFTNSTTQSKADKRLLKLNRPPNVIFVLADTLRRDRLGFHGYDRHPTSPTLDAFAARSTVFNNAIANSSWTIPSMASLWTGRWLIEHGSSAEMRLLADTFPTLPGILRRYGYRTMAVSSNSMINGPLQGYTTPFDWVQDTSTDPAAVRRTRRATRDFFRLRETAMSLVDVSPGAPYFVPNLPENPGDLGVYETTEAALQYIDMARKSDQPFFLFAGYFANHMPYQFPPDFDSGFEVAPKPPQREWDPVIRSASVPVLPSILLVYWRQLLAATGTHSYTEDDLLYLSDRYDQTVKYLDEQVGRLLAGIEDRGLLEDTLVIFTSDHGESLGEHADFGHGLLLAPQLIEVPLFIYDPDRPEGQEVDRPVQSIDILPTVLARTGIEERAATGKPLPGSDLFGAGSATPIVSELHYNAGAPGWEHAEPLSQWMEQILANTIQGEMNLMLQTSKQLPDQETGDDQPSLKTYVTRWIERVREQPTIMADLAGQQDDSPGIDTPLGSSLPGVTERAFRDYYFSARRALITEEWIYVRTSTGEELLYDRATGLRTPEPPEATLAPLRERLAKWRAQVSPFDQPIDLTNASQTPYLR